MYRHTSAKIRNSATFIQNKVFLAAAVAAVVVSGILITTGQVSALFTFINGHMKLSGTVVGVHGAGFEIDTDGTAPFLIVVDEDTKFKKPYQQLADLEIGDTVKVKAHEKQGYVLAEMVDKLHNGGYGYGQDCEQLHLKDVYISAIDDDRMLLSRAGITFDVAYDDSTMFLGAELDELLPGDVVTVMGTDCGDEGYAANKVMLKHKPQIAECKERGSKYHVVHNAAYLLSHDEGGAYITINDVAVPAGEYKVYGVSYDNHADKSWDTSMHEQWYATGWHEGEQVFSSSETNDLPDGVNTNMTMIGNLAIEEGLDQLQLIHAAYPDPGYHSIVPACVIFEPVKTSPAARDQR